MHLIGRYTLQPATSVQGFECQAFIEKRGLPRLLFYLDGHFLISLRVSVEA